MESGHTAICAHAGTQSKLELRKSSATSSDILCLDCPGATKSQEVARREDAIRIKRKPGNTQRERTQVFRGRMSDGRSPPSDGDRFRLRREIGRASCRERV